jgi:hypothetical protein
MEECFPAVVKYGSCKPHQKTSPIRNDLRTSKQHTTHEGLDKDENISLDANSGAESPRKPNLFRKYYSSQVPLHWVAYFERLLSNLKPLDVDWTIFATKSCRGNHRDPIAL